MSIMETMLDDLLDTMAATTKKAEDLGLGFRPKAIYLCKTNINQDDGTPDLPSRPFLERRAPPILIWRHLVSKGVHPDDIAVYCELKFNRSDNPPPEGFNLFSGGESDFGAFTAGNFKHVIFNLSFQEGWDDPAVGFAYIDKSMGSTVQVEQVIGRALRQPGAMHYPDVDLNTATFFVRVDNHQEFPRILNLVRQKLGAELPEVEIRGYDNRRERQRATQAPKQALQVPEIHVDAEGAEDTITDVMAQVHDYRQDNLNTLGAGASMRATQRIGDGSAAVAKELVAPTRTGSWHAGSSDARCGRSFPGQSRPWNGTTAASTLRWKLPARRQPLFGRTQKSSWTPSWREATSSSKKATPTQSAPCT